MAPPPTHTDVPWSLTELTRLTRLDMADAFGGRSWSRSQWETKLSGLSHLCSLRHLDLSDNDLPALPLSVTGLTALDTLKLGLNPLAADVGLPDGRYLDGLTYLDVSGTRMLTSFLGLDVLAVS